MVDVFDPAGVVARDVGRDHFVAVHAGLHGADGVDLDDAHDHAFLAQARRRALADIAVADDHRPLARHQHVGGALDGVVQAVPAAVAVVVLGLGDGVVDVDRRYPEFAVGEHLVESMDAGRGFLADAVDAVQHRRVLVVDHLGQVAAVVEQQVRIPGLAILQDGLLDAPVVLRLRLALPRVDGDAVGGHGGGGVILGREDVARRPAHLGAEFDQGADQHRRLDGHVDAADDLRPGERSFGRVTTAQRHEGGHLGLGKDDLPATEFGERDIGDFVVGHEGASGLAIADTHHISRRIVAVPEWAEVERR